MLIKYGPNLVFKLKFDFNTTNIKTLFLCDMIILVIFSILFDF
jgi:hypothetical protein